MTPVFLDTVGLLALWDQDDQWHSPAVSAFNSIRQRRLPVVTTELVLLECGNAAARRPYREAVCELRLAMQQRGELLVPTPDDYAAAWQAYASRTSAAAGIVDQISFGVMRRLELKTAFTNDEHFRAAGFETLF